MDQIFFYPPSLITRYRPSLLLILLSFPHNVFKSYIQD